MRRNVLEAARAKARIVIPSDVPVISTPEERAESQRRADAMATVHAFGCAACCGLFETVGDGSTINCPLFQPRLNIPEGDLGPAKGCKVPEMYEKAAKGRLHPKPTEVLEAVPYFVNESVWAAAEAQEDADEEKKKNPPQEHFPNLMPIVDQQAAAKTLEAPRLSEVEAAKADVRAEATGVPRDE